MAQLILQPQQFAPDLFHLGLYESKSFLSGTYYGDQVASNSQIHQVLGSYTTMPGYNKEVLSHWKGRIIIGIQISLLNIELEMFHIPFNPSS